jgi:hypothetical protein
MAKLTIKDTPGLDGEYEIDLTAGFTKAEYYLMKKRVGVVIGDLTPGSPIDMNVMTAFGLVLLERAGKGHLAEVFMQTTDAQTDWDWEDAEVTEDDALPPASESGSVTRPSLESESSGASTNGSSDDSQERIPGPIGSPPSATTAI